MERLKESAMEKHARLQHIFKDPEYNDSTKLHMLRRVCHAPPTSLHYTAMAMKLNLDTLKKNPNQYEVFAQDTFDAYVPEKVIPEVIVMLVTCVYLTTTYTENPFVNSVRRKAEKALQMLLPLHEDHRPAVYDCLNKLGEDLTENVLRLLSEMEAACY